MKNLFLLLFAICIISCSDNNNENMIAANATYSDTNTDLLSKSQKDFIESIATLSEKYGDTTTKINQQDVGNAARVVLESAVDALAGAPLGGLAGWLIGVGASELYSDYLDYCSNKVSSKSINNNQFEYIDIRIDKNYQKLSKQVDFIFCDNNPQTVQDSVGYLHNLLLNHRNTTVHYDYITNDNIDYDTFFTHIEGSARELGYGDISIKEITNLNIQVYFNDLLNCFGNNEMSIDEAFNSIALSIQQNMKLSPKDAIFISTVSKYVTLCLTQEQLQNIPSLALNLNNIIKNSNLSKENILMCKTLLQIMMSSSVYWRTQELYRIQHYS